MSTSSRSLVISGRSRGLLLAASLAALLACDRPSPPRGESLDAPPPGTTAPSAALVSLSREFLGSSGCATCHAKEAAAHAASPHALDLQLVHGELPHAESGRPIQDESVLITHRIGGRRRAVWLGAFDGSLQVLPSAWSQTQGAWIDHGLDDGRARGSEESERPAGPAWRADCAGCHPSAPSAAGPDVELSPEEARGLAPGIGCEHCHGPGAAHAQLARERPDDGSAIRSAIVRSAAAPWQGCDHCHASGRSLPLEPGPALRAGDELSAHRLVATAIDALRPDVRFFADGRPAQAHGLAVQSLAQSRCFQAGGLSCLTCHDPHGGGLKDEDPDASCRSCHAEQASDRHSGHPSAAPAVPPSLEESRGPDSSRSPGCVDCHAPALIAFGSVDRVRDHAFGIPEPELTRDFNMPDACTLCHADRDPDELIAWLAERFPSRRTPRHTRAAAFRRVLELSPIGESALAADAVKPLLSLLADESEDPWLQASAASALGLLGAEAREAAPALLAAAESGPLELAHAAAAALGLIGTDALPRLIRIARSHADWRVRLVAASSLDALGDAEGAAELEVIAADAALPRIAHAQAHLQLGLALMRRGLLERAVFQLEESLRFDPRSIPTWLNLGVARAGIDDGPGARLAWLTVLDLEAGNLAARRNLQLLEQRESDRSP